MKASDIDWKSGNVRFWDLAVLAEGNPVAAQAHELKEDLAQIEYPCGVALDVGWYPSFAADGAFTVMVVRNERWDEPLFCARCVTMQARS